MMLSVTHLHRVNVLQWRSQDISDPFINLHSKKLCFVSHRLLSGLKLFG